jgi:23S rRNA (guanosine2251-2'-O)-methyltransferase
VPSGRPPRPGYERGPRPGRWPGAGPGPAFPAARRVGSAPAPRLGEDEEVVAGRRPVEEAFAARRPARRLLVVPHRREALEQIVLHATRLRIPIVEVEGGSLTAVAGFDGHQGVALVVERRRPASIDEILARAVTRSEPPFILVLDSLEDPQNVGTLLRSAEAAGVHGVVYPLRRQAPVTPAAEKASAGAVEPLLLAPVDDLPGALVDLRARGVRVIGSEAQAPLTARQADLRGPLAVVVGSEGRGLGAAVRRRCDLFIRIPMRGAIGSLNAAVAGSILLFEAVAQREPDEGPDALDLPGPTERVPGEGAGATLLGPDGIGDEPITEAAATPAPAAVDGPADEADGTATEATSGGSTEDAALEGVAGSDEDLLPGGPDPA